MEGNLIKRAVAKLKRMLRPPVEYQGHHHKKLALCVAEEREFTLGTTALGENCGIVRYREESGDWTDNGRSLSLDEVKAEYEYLWFVPEGVDVTEGMVLNLLLKFSKVRVDFLLLSWLLYDMPDISVPADSWGSLVLASGRVAGWKQGNLSRSYGQVLRLFCEDDGSFATMKTESFFAERLGLSEGLYYNAREVVFDDAPPYKMQPEPFRPPFSPDPQRPTILVLPAFLMVGGVERNTVGVMEQLQDRYNFVMAVTDGIEAKNGSMHYQMRKCTAVLYDLFETIPYAQSLEALAELKEAYRPQAVWICNGSTWICDNAPGLRRVFEDLPIIDQEVYDTEAGWINRYLEPGIQSYDRFIAINRRIYDKFTGEFRMPKDRVDIRYPVVNLNILSTADQFDGREMKEKYGIPHDKRVFAFIGRLFSQKRPLLLVRLIEAINRLQPGENHFMIIGNGELKEPVLREIDKRGLENITTVDFIHNVNEVYCFLEGILFVSEYEGLPIVVLESLINGIPVLSTDVGDVKLVLEEYAAGMIFDCGLREDVPSMARDFVSFRDRLPEYAANIEARKGEIRHRFSVQTIADEWDESFRTAIARKKEESRQ